MKGHARILNIAELVDLKRKENPWEQTTFFPVYIQNF